MITPISLESDIEVVRKQLAAVKKVGAERFHIDIIDGLYADNVTVSPADLQELDLSGVKIDLHLLVDDPVEWMEECVALRPHRIFSQIERMGNIEYYIETLRGYGEVHVGLGLDLFTPIETIESETLGKVDAILLMSVKAGFSGQEFDSHVVSKIQKLREKYDGSIVIDGGITSATYSDVIRAGASEAAANSALWHGDFEENLKKFKEP